MADRGPYLSALVHGRQRLYRHFQDIGNFRRALLTVDLIFDRRLLRSEIVADQWRERRHRAAGGAGKDRAQRFSLLVVRALVDIGSRCPVTVGHRPRSVGDHRDVQAVQLNAAVITLIYMKNQGYVTSTLRWL